MTNKDKCTHRLQRWGSARMWSCVCGNFKSTCLVFSLNENESTRVSSLARALRHCARAGRRSTSYSLTKNRDTRMCIRLIITYIRITNQFVIGSRISRRLMSLWACSVSSTTRDFFYVGPLCRDRIRPHDQGSYYFNRLELCNINIIYLQT